METPLFIQKAAKTDSERLDNIETILRLTLLTAGGSMPVTQIATGFDGLKIGTTNKYLELYRNNFLRLLAVKVSATFSGAGQTANLSLTTDLSNYGVIDTLTIGTKVTSDTIWLKPDQSLYINTANTAVNLTGAQFRVLMFDPLSFADFLNAGV
jgi:hypothetical protein